MSVPTFVIPSSSVGPFNSLSFSLQSTLKEIPGASEVPVIHAWNKIDSAAQPERVRAAALDRWPNTVCISAATGEGIEELKERCAALEAEKAAMAAEKAAMAAEKAAMAAKIAELEGRL